MNLTNSQYNSLQREYSAKRLRNLSTEDKRRSEIYEKIPEYKELDESLSSMSMRRGREFLKGDKSALLSLREELFLLKTKKTQLLKQNGYPEDYLEPIYDCKLCKDTGYVTDENGQSQKCRCFREKEIEILYDQSNIRELIKKDNFQTLSFDYQTGEDRERFENAVSICQNFVRNFSKDYSNLFIYGSVGTGKSFLSGCIANELLKKGHSVLYFSSVSFFETIANYTFGGKEKFEGTSIYEDLKDCDLLIIDDLGTEMNNSFVTSSLLNIINERHLNRKATIISSNLDPGQIEKLYTPRVFSRIISNYYLCKLTGNDIRLEKKKREMQQNG